MHDIDLRRVDLNLLTVFEALMEEGHVGRAAARLALSQSATSHALGRLRQTFDDPLFVRWPHGVRPTVKAEALSPLLNAILSEIRALLAPPATFDPRELRRRVLIGATDYSSFVVMPRFMAELRRTAPYVDVQVRSIDQASIASALDRQDIDLAIGLYPDPEKRIEVLPLFEERLVGVCRMGHPALEAPLSPSAFANLPHLMVALNGAGRHNQRASGPIDEALEVLGLKRRVVLTVPHFLVAPFIIGASDLVAVLGSRIVLSLGGTANLAMFDCPVAAPSWPISLVRLRASSFDPGIAFVSDTLRMSCRDL